jgi:hypothetical protein
MAVSTANFLSAVMEFSPDSGEGGVTGYRIVDRKIVENWCQSDGLSLADQLGMKLTPTEACK